MDEARVVCSSNLFASLDRRAAFARIGALGFRYVDLWASPLICGHADLLAEEPASVRADLEDAGLEAASLTVFLLTSEERERSLNMAEGVGARYVVIEPGPAASWPTVMTNLEAPGRLLGDPGQSMTSFLDLIEAYAKEAARRGLRCCLEVPHVATLMPDRAGIDEFLRDPRSAGYGLTFAPPHLALAEEPLVPTVETLAAHIAMFYLWNVKPGYVGSADGRGYGTGAEQLSPDGALDTKGAAQRLLEIGGDRDYVIAAHGTEGNPDGEAVSRMVAAAVRQLPDSLLEQLRSDREPQTRSR